MSKPPIHLANLIAVRQSFRRCCQDTEFFDSFYHHLACADDEIGPMFAETDMLVQNSLLQEGISQMLGMAAGEASARERIEALGRIHDRNHRNIRPELYTVWMDSLLTAVRDSDPEYSAELATQWTSALKESLELMQAMYNGQSSG